MILNSWGRYPQTVANLLEPLNAEAAQRLLNAHGKEDSLIARGAGRSYGDSALAPVVMSSRFLDSFIAFDEVAGVIHCGAGVSLDTILKVAIPKQWFLAVIPGSKFVSVGGAVAADVHGKNHHVDGSFCQYVIELNLLLASGEIISCSPTHNADLFHATCGGMGLTGIICDMKIQLNKVPGVFINRTSIVTDNLQTTFDALEANSAAKYSVAWLDCLAQGEKLGRSAVYLGEHATDARFQHKQGLGVNVPFATPAMLLNKYSMSAFNSIYFNLKKITRKSSKTNYDAFFFPLDNIKNWNRLYGGNGFLQYQFVVPTDAAYSAISDILQKVANAGKGSFLTVLKKFGAANKNLLSFPIEGYTLTLDFKREKSLFPLLSELDDIVLASGGRLYLAKDARMSESMFKQGYPQWEAFAELKTQIDPENVFGSLQSQRLGLGSKHRK
ncbi:MAG: decaprenylphospho-beta-D-ribofuranose 2-oxidase [Pseudohongiellaceae bacterium]|jgi:decaprenylphospho-beta-D-ribofuranose 2-oxidase